MPQDENREQNSEGYREEPAGGFEDPAQRPASEASEDDSTGYQDPEKRPGRWPPATLFGAVLVLLFAGFAILVVIWFIASR